MLTSFANSSARARFSAITLALAYLFNKNKFESNLFKSMGYTFEYCGDAGVAKRDSSFGI